MPLRLVEVFGTIEERFFESCVEAGHESTVLRLCPGFRAALHTFTSSRSEDFELPQGRWEGQDGR